MLCRNCGNQLTEGVTFCPKCLATVAQQAPIPNEPDATFPVQPYKTSPPPQSAQPACAPWMGGRQANLAQPTPMKTAISVTSIIDKTTAAIKAKPIIVAPVAAVLVVLMVFLSVSAIFGRGNAENTLEKYCKAYFKGKTQTVMKLTALDEMGYFYSAAIKYTADESSEKFGWFSVKVKIISKNVSENKDLESIALDIKDSLDSYVGSAAKIKKISKHMEVEAEITISGNGDKEVEKRTFEMFKMGGKWYVYPELI
jgi:pyruvoyl-dependent arginine decarboxylase (PvlArgDC)